MNRLPAPEIIYEIWSRSPDKLDDQLVSYIYTSRKDADKLAELMTARVPEREYFVREYRNPGWSGENV